MTSSHLQMNMIMCLTDLTDLPQQNKTSQFMLKLQGRALIIPPVPCRHTMELALQRPPAVLILAQLLLSDLDRNLIIKPFAEGLIWITTWLAIPLGLIQWQYHLSSYPGAAGPCIDSQNMGAAWLRQSELWLERSQKGTTESIWLRISVSIN